MYQATNILHKTYSRFRHIFEKLMSKAKDNGTLRAILEIGEKVMSCQDKVLALVICLQDKEFPPKTHSRICIELACAKAERRHWLKLAQRQKNNAQICAGENFFTYHSNRRIVS